MARKKRIWYPGATYHVMSRGNRRYSIFKDEWDYEMFILCLKKVKEQYDFKIYSICLMTNHFHMVVGTGNTEICIISEYPPGTQPRVYTFPRRNRLIAALSDELYVIDAGRHSGTRTTVEKWEEYERGVKAV